MIDQIGSSMVVTAAAMTLSFRRPFVAKPGQVRNFPALRLVRVNLTFSKLQGVGGEKSGVPVMNLSATDLILAGQNLLIRGWFSPRHFFGVLSKVPLSWYGKSLGIY